MARFFNNTDTIQSVRIRDRYGSYYTIFIESKGFTDLEPYQITKDITDKITLGKLVNLDEAKIIGRNIPSNEKSSVVIDTIKIEELQTSISEETETDTIEDETESYSVSSDVDTSEVHVCEICGNEYASKKGLEMHKSRSHK